MQGSSEPFEGARRQDGTVWKLVQAGSQADQVTGEVSAIDRGNVARGERAERQCVVPVEEMALEALEAFHRFEGAGGAVEEAVG